LACLYVVARLFDSRKGAKAQMNNAK
jgi:hypothetical protein